MNIEQVLNQFSELRVLVIGDLMIDRYLLGKVSRVSPEAPVPVVDWEKEENRLGGAANVAFNVASLGANVVLCGIVGVDSESQTLFELLEQNRIDSSLVIQSNDRPTTVKSRVIANDQHLLRIDKEVKTALSEKTAALLIERIRQYTSTQKVDVIILQDYNKGVLTSEVIEQLIALAEDFKIPVSVDPKYDNFWAYKNVQLFKPNLREVKNILPFPLDLSSKTLQKAIEYLQENLNCGMLLITLSEQGLLTYQNGSLELYPTEARQVADVCGAGDAVIAIASLSIAIGLPEHEIAELANLAGGQVVEKVGVASIDKSLLVKEMKQKKAKTSG